MKHIRHILAVVAGFIFAAIASAGIAGPTTDVKMTKTLGAETVATKVIGAGTAQAVSGQVSNNAALVNSDANEFGARHAVYREVVSWPAAMVSDAAAGANYGNQRMQGTANFMANANATGLIIAGTAATDQKNKDDDANTVSTVTMLASADGASNMNAVTT